jgi:RNA polymerase sigma factor (sigma-70 family)
MATSPMSEIIQHLRKTVLLPDGAGLSDGQLLSRFIEGRDEDAFAALVKRHGPMVWGVCRRLLDNHHDVEDAFQATFLVLVRKAVTILPREMVANWLYGVAYMTAQRSKVAVAKARRRERQFVEMPQPVADEPDLWDDLRPLLDLELSRLPDRYRVVILLCDLEGKSRKEVARQLGLPEGTVGSRLARARAMLAKRVARHGLAVSAGALAAVLSQNAASADVPISAVSSTLAAVTSLAMGPTTTATIWGTVAEMVNEVLKAMLLKKLRIAAMVLAFLAALAAVGAGGLLCSAENVREDSKIAHVADGADGLDEAKADLPLGAVVRLGTVRFRHPGMVSALALSKNGKVLATGGGDGTMVCLWDAETGKPLRRLHRPWSWTDLRPHEPFWTKSLAFSPDGRTVLASGPSGLLCLWSVDNGRPLRRLLGHRVMVRAAAFSPDGATIASASDDGAVYLWQAATGKQLRRCEGQRKHDVWSIAFAPDGKTLVTGGNCGELFLYDVATGRELRPCRGHRSVVTSVHFGKDGRSFVSGSHDGTIRLWETASGRELQRFRAGEVWAVALSSDSASVAALTREHFVHVWDLATAREMARFNVGWNVQGSLVFAPDGKSLIVSDGCSISRWDVATAKLLLLVQGHRAVLSSLSFAPDGKTLASGGWDGAVCLWDPATGAMIRRLAGHDDMLHAVSFSPSGRVLASVSAGGAILLWDPSTGRPLHRLRGYARSRLTLSFSHDGKTLASQGTEGLVHSWDVATGRDRGPWQGRQHFVIGVAFSPDGRLLASAGLVRRTDPKRSDDETITLWSVSSRREVRQLEGHSSLIGPVVFSPRGNVLASGAWDSTVRVWETATGGERCRFSVPVQQTPAIAFSPTGALLAIGCLDGTIRLRDLDTGEACGEVRGPQGGICALAFSPDCTRLASGGRDSAILLWDVARVCRVRPRPAVDLPKGEIEALWSDLTSPKAGSGYRALCRLAAARRQAVQLVQERVRPVAAPDQRRLAGWIRDLNDERFATREKASAELAALGEVAVPALKEALDRQPPAEAARSIRRLLEKQEQAILSPEELRLLRSVELLEMVGTAEARRVLSALAEGAVGSRLTREARAAVHRLARRPVSRQ